MASDNSIWNKIATKGIILVFVPLLFELACGLTLFALQYYYESVLAQEAKIKSAIYHTNDLWMESTSLITHALRTRLHPNKRNPEKRAYSLGEIENNYRIVKELIGANESQLARLQNILAVSAEIRDVSGQMDELDATPAQGLRKYIAMKEDLRLVKQMQSLLQSLGEEIRQFREPEELKARQAKDTVSRIRIYIRVALASAFLASVVLAAALLVYFMRGIYKGIRVMLSNTSRLAQSKPLLPEIGTTDELGTLDRTFHQMAEAVEKARQRELATISNAVDMICAFSHDLKLTLINPAGKTLLGYSQDELIGRELSSLILPDDRTLVANEVATIMSEDRQGSFECRLPTRNGSVKVTSWAGKWSATEQEFFCVVHDITERRKLEDLKRAFTAMVSHELRTPLTAIQGYLSNLNIGALGAVPNQLRREAAVAEEDAAGLIRLINDFLDLEKLEAGKMQVRPRLIYAETAIEQAIETQKASLEQKEITIEATETDAEIYADPDRIVQVLSRLLSNAIKFSGNRTTVKIDTIQHPEGVEIRVTDQGRGVPETLRERIFERFAQIEADSAGGTRGPRFGLPICREIIMLHGGAIGVTSDEGKGSTFWFKLPEAP